MTGRRRLQYLATGALALLVVGCGGSSHPVSGALVYGPMSAEPAAHAVTSAQAERNKLLALAKPGTKVTSQGTLSAWPPANGAAIPATPSEASGFGFVVDQAKKVQYLGFAVKDTAGHCAGGDIEANLAGTSVQSARPVTIPAHAPCTGNEAAKAAGHA